MTCPYCGNEPVYMTSKEFYGKDFGANMYVCRPCNAYVGTHGRSKTPLGTLANAELREWRKRAHSLFDPMWKSGKMQRGSAYRWLQKVMDLSEKEAHIGMFDIEKCKKLITVLQK